MTETKSKKNTAKKIIAVAIPVLILGIVLVVSILTFSGNKSVLKFKSVLDNETSNVIPLNDNAKKSIIKNNGYAEYKFTDAQKELFKSVVKKYGNVALIIRMELIPSEQNKSMLNAGVDFPFKTGFFYEKDFDAKGKLINEETPDAEKITVSGNLSDLYSTFKTTNGALLFDVSFGIGKGEDCPVPEGFFVYSSTEIKISDICAAPAELGYDFSKEVPFFGYSTNGGRIDCNVKNVDFSAASFLFPVKNTLTDRMPYIELKLSSVEGLQSTLEDTKQAKLSFGTEKCYVKNVKPADNLTLSTAAFNNPFSLITITDDFGILDSIIMKSAAKVDFKEGIENNENEVFDPVVTDPGLILDWNVENWRCPDYEIYEWDRFPGILFFDIKNYDVQDQFFRRLAYYVEKAGYKGTLVSNKDLDGKHGYNAHDYSAESLASFFNKATETGFVLNKEEETLKKILIQNDLLIPDGDFVKAGFGGLVSISRETANWSRVRLLAHEGWHTLYFRNEDFRNFVSMTYFTMDAVDTLSRQFLNDYFASQPSLGYDQNDNYLMLNEFMAYLMQQPLGEVGTNFVNWANWESVKKYAPETSLHVRQTNGQGFEDAAAMLNDYVFENYGVVSGNISLVTR